MAGLGDWLGVVLHPGRDLVPEVLSLRRHGVFSEKLYSPSLGSLLGQKFGGWTPGLGPQPQLGQFFDLCKKMLGFIFYFQFLIIFSGLVIGIHMYAQICGFKIKHTTCFKLSALFCRCLM